MKRRNLEKKTRGGNFVDMAPGQGRLFPSDLNSSLILSRLHGGDDRKFFGPAVETGFWTFDVLKKLLNIRCA